MFPINIRNKEKLKELPQPKFVATDRDFHILVPPPLNCTIVNPTLH
jgi:hypothetical protein